MVRGAALLGVGAAALPALAACGPEEAAESKPSAGQRITAAADVPVGGGVILDDPGIVVTQPTSGSFEGFSPICPHQGCNVTEIVGQEIECPCHGSRFSIDDGSVTQGPAQEGLERIAVKLQGSEIVGG